MFDLVFWKQKKTRNSDERYWILSKFELLRQFQVKLLNKWVRKYVKLVNIEKSYQVNMILHDYLNYLLFRWTLPCWFCWWLTYFTKRYNNYCYLSMFLYLSLYSKSKFSTKVSINLEIHTLQFYFDLISSD